MGLIINSTTSCIKLKKNVHQPPIIKNKRRQKQTNKKRERENTYPISRRRQESLTLKVLGKKSSNTDLWI